MDELRDLKDEAARAMGRGQWQDALKHYGALAAKDPADGTWPLRAGDAARRLGSYREAITWYERAASTYGEQGFVVRAIAVGKMIQSLDPTNDRILKTLDAAQKQRSTATPPPKPVQVPLPSRRTTPRRDGVEGGPLALPSKPSTAAARKKAPPPLPKGDKGPPLSRHLGGPPLTPLPADPEPSMRSMEIVFDDLDDNIPIQASDILAVDELVEVVENADALDDEEILANLPSFPLFQVLPRGAFLAVVSEMDYLVVKKGEVVVRQGELGTTLYAIIEGQAVVHLEGRRDKPLATLTAGEIFGEMALFLDQPRAATVEALTTLELFEMDRELFRTLIDDHPQLATILSRMIKRRLVENVMTTAPLFQQLDPETRKEMMLRFQVREVTAGTKLVEQGTPSDGLYLVLNGSVDVLTDDRVTTVLGPGQTFGVASLIDAQHKSPTGFRAPSDTMVLRLPRSSFHEIISCYPPVLEHLAEVAERQQAWGKADSVPVV